MLNYFSFYMNKVSPQVIPSKHAITITRMLASWQEESAPLRHVWIHIKLQTPHLIIEKWKVHQSPGKKNKNIRSSHMRSQYSHLWDGPKDFRIEAAMCFKGAAMVGVECSFPQTKHQGAGNVADQFFFQGLKWGRFPKNGEGNSMDPLNGKDDESWAMFYWHFYQIRKGEKRVATMWLESRTDWWMDLLWFIDWLTDYLLVLLQCGF